MTIVIGPNSGRTLALGEGLELCFKADDAETEGRYSVSVVDVAARDAGTTPHIHAEHDELFFVVSGTPRFELAGEEHAAEPGTFVLASRGTRHRWWNPADTPARVLNIHAPSFGFERFIHELVDLSDRRAATPAAMSELGARHDVRFDLDLLERRYDDAP